MTTTSEPTAESLDQTDAGHPAFQGRHDGVKLIPVPRGHPQLEPYFPVTPAKPSFDPIRPANGTPVPDGHGPLVRGVECRKGHLNDPKLLFCIVCGLALVHTTGPKTGIRPPLGVLTGDDGGVYPVEPGGMVIGRNPWRDELVAAGIAVPLQFSDPVVSRVHAYLLPAGWAVTIRDAGSTHGTFLQAPGDAAWTRLEHGLTVPLVPGARLTVGRHQLRFDSPHNPEPAS